MKKSNKVLGLIIITVMLLSLTGTGCGGGSQTSDTPAPVTVTDKDSGNAIDLAQGQQLIVRLPSNPSTGYSWTLVEQGSGLTKSDGSPAFESDQAAEEPARPGAGGTEVWIFTGASAGQQQLSFEYKRQWEAGVPPAQKVSYSVEVR